MSKKGKIFLGVLAAIALIAYLGKDYAQEKIISQAYQEVDKYAQKVTIEEPVISATDGISPKGQLYFQNGQSASYYIFSVDGMIDQCYKNNPDQENLKKYKADIEKYIPLVEYQFPASVKENQNLKDIPLYKLNSNIAQKLICEGFTWKNNDLYFEDKFVRFVLEQPK